MALPLEKLGTRYEPRTATIDVDRARAYAAATNDPNPAYLSGELAPPVFAVVPTWDAMMVALHDVVPAPDQVAMLHAEQDMHFFQPLIPGRPLVTFAEAYSLRSGRMGTRFTMRVVSSDEAGDLVAEQFATMLIRGVEPGDDGGPTPPSHALPSEAKAAKLASVSSSVDPDQALRYAEASGDANPIHVDDVAAKAVGLPGVILHGMCTMALCGRDVVDELAAGVPTRLRRLAVRFYRPVFPGNDLVTTMYDVGTEAGRQVVAFEASSAGKVVIRDGRADLGPPMPAVDGPGRLGA
ncbi:MAG: MaoC family dehydratase N-terminal domain-containing protein [Actinomycetota bacterium]|nr:MaoC family dehydratase N-terminal domain-containing protein [Actinomycetota bacterium]